MEKGGTVIEAGPVSFGMSYRREIMTDQGLCLRGHRSLSELILGVFNYCILIQYLSIHPEGWPLEDSTA